MNGFVAQYVLKLLAYAGHAILAMKREHHHKTAVKENAFHDDIEANEVFDEALHSLNCVRGKSGLRMSDVSFISNASLSRMEFTS